MNIPKYIYGRVFLKQAALWGGIRMDTQFKAVFAITILTYINLLTLANLAFFAIAKEKWGSVFSNKAICLFTGAVIYCCYYFYLIKRCTHDKIMLEVGALTAAQHRKFNALSLIYGVGSVICLVTVVRLISIHAK